MICIGFDSLASHSSCTAIVLQPWYNYVAMFPIMMIVTTSRNMRDNKPQLCTIEFAIEYGIFDVGCTCYGDLRF